MKHLPTGPSIRRFPFGSEGRILKSYAGRPPLALLGRYAISGLSAISRAARSADVVYAHWAVPTGFLAALAARHRPLVLHLHGSDIETYARRSRLWGALARYAVRRARAVLAVGEPLAAWAREAGARQVEVVPMGVDLSRFHAPSDAERAAARAACGFAADEKIVAFVGDRTLAKGAPALEAALARLGQGFRGLFIAKMPPADVARHLHAADLLCLPSRSEGAPLAVMEALASGLPVVATRVGAIASLVGAEGADLLVDVDDACALDEAIRRASTRPRTPGSRVPVPTLDAQAARIADILLEAAS